MADISFANVMSSEMIPEDLIQKAIIIVEPGVNPIAIQTTIITANKTYLTVDFGVTEFDLAVSYFTGTSQEAKSVKFIVKRELKSTHNKTKGLLNKELSVYSTLLQEFHNQSPHSHKNKLQNKRQVFLSKELNANPTPWSPVILLGENANFRFLFLKKPEEDYLPAANYSTKLDFNHSLVVMETLARLHANSYFLKKQMAKSQGKTSISSFQILNKYPFAQESMFSPNNSKLMSKLYEECFELVCKVVEMENPSLGMKLRRKIQGATIFDKLVSLLENEKYENSDLYVFCHGNLTLNNFLFKYEKSDKAIRDREPLECKIANFEFLRYGPLASDLAYFFSCCTDGSLKKDYQEKLIAHYCDMFENELVEKLGMPQAEFDIEEFHRAVEEQFYGRMMEFGFLTSSLILPLMTVKISHPDSPHLSVNENNISQIIDQIKEHLMKDTEIQARILDNVKRIKL